MPNLLGFVALIIALFAMTQKKMITLRWWHLASSSLYIIYGIAIHAVPIIIGAVLYCGIHIWQILKFYKQRA